MADFRVRELVRDRPVRRDLTCVNVDRAAKSGFEDMVRIYSARVGRSLTHWEAFAIMVAEAEERYAFELQTLRGR